MRFSRLLVLALAVSGPAAYLTAADPPQPPTPKRLLLVTHCGGFFHDSVGVAEEVLKDIGPKQGFAVTCYRFTGDPSDAKAFEKYGTDFRAKTGLTVGPENCGRVNKDTLKNFDCVLFYTTGNPLTKDELADLAEWVKAGGGVAGVHSGSDTLYARPATPWNAAYGDMIGGYFDGHPWKQKVKLVVEDPKHPAAGGFQTGSEINDEIYQFKPQPYSRDKLHVVVSIDNTSIDVSKGKRADKDYAVAWCQEVGKGKGFYTSLGHYKDVWKDERFQSHLLGGLKWASGLLPGDATPSAKLKK
jgi:type 1 glutamine amidotransferase